MVKKHCQCIVLFPHGKDSVFMNIYQRIESRYCRTHNVSVCLYIAYIACSSASLYIKTLYFFLTVLALSASATVANIKIRYDAKILQFAIFGRRGICVFQKYQFIKSRKILNNDILIGKYFLYIEY